MFQNHFTKPHLFVFAGIWLRFTALTYWTSLPAASGINSPAHGSM